MITVKDAQIDWSKWENVPEDSWRIKPASTWCGEVLESIHNPKLLKGAILPWSRTHRDVRFAQGEMTLWGGINGHKKSMVLGQIILGFNQQNEKVCIASLEMQPVKTLKRLTHQATGMDKPSAEFIQVFHDWTNKKLWLYDQTGTVNHNRVVGLTRYCFSELDIDHMVIDSMMKCGIATKNHDLQKEFIDQLCAVAKDFNKHIHLVVHTRKGESEYSKPGKHDVSGSSDITNQVDNLFIIWDNKKKHEEMKKPQPEEHLLNQPDLLLMCKKQRNGDWEGQIPLYFISGSLQHVDNRAGRSMDLCGLNTLSLVAHGF